jgi:hypothetical protein
MMGERFGDSQLFMMCWNLGAIIRYQPVALPKKNRALRGFDLPPQGTSVVFPLRKSQLEWWSAAILDFRMQISDLRVKPRVARNPFSVNLQSAI